jgi:transcriptional regulator with XRE-family HTH domain
MDTLQNSRPAFRKYRQARGWTLKQVAERLRMTLGSVWKLENGTRPRDWGRIRALARLFQLTLSEASREFWHLAIGDPCPYHTWCGGVTVDPDRDEARHLYVAIKCEKCPRIRTYSKARYHSGYVRTAAGSASQRSRQSRIQPSVHGGSGAALQKPPSRRSWAAKSPPSAAGTGERNVREAGEPFAASPSDFK